MIRWVVSIAVVLLSASPLRAGQVPNDFARGFSVEPEEARPLWELRLPDDVYRTATRQDVGDLRVFNRDGAIVPHRVRRPAALLAEPPQPRPLSFFAVRRRSGEGRVDRGLRIVTNERGAIINVTREGSKADDTAGVEAYLCAPGNLRCGGHRHGPGIV